LERQGSDSSWALSAISFANLPFYRYDLFKHFDALRNHRLDHVDRIRCGLQCRHVGTHIHVNGGFVTITGYTSATVLAGTSPRH